MPIENELYGINISALSTEMNGILGISCLVEEITKRGIPKKLASRLFD